MENQVDALIKHSDAQAKEVKKIQRNTLTYKLADSDDVSTIPSRNSINDAYTHYIFFAANPRSGD